MNTEMPTMFVPTLEKPTPFPTDTPTAMPTSTVITPSDTCGTCPLVGEKYIPTFGCEVFYSCEDRALHRCPAGLLFDVDAQLCNWPGDFTCTCTETTTSTPTSSAPTMNTDMPTMFVPTLEKPTPFPTDTPTSIASGGVTKTSNPTPGETEMPTTFFNPSTEIPTTMPTESPTLLNTELPTVLIDNDTPAPTGLGSVFWFPNAYNGGGPDVCLFDGGLELPAATPKFATRQECCLGFYAWNFRECMGNNGPTNRYFPNWTREEGSSDVCLLDDGTYVVPEGTPQYETVQECCENHYSWNLDACNNVENEPSYKYFPNWDGNGYVCFLDDGTHVVPDSAPLFDDLTSCCDSQYSWNTAQCNSVYGPSYKYFPNLHGVEPICFFDDGGFTLPFAVIDDDDDAAIDIPFGAPLYDDIRSCCDAQYPWARDECISYHYM
eukprot:scaffold8160_cov38-Cyclotella_meneghiniana.AAC.2